MENNTITMKKVLLLIPKSHGRIFELLLVLCRKYFWINFEKRSTGIKCCHLKSYRHAILPEQSRDKHF